jgi:hypothetical protein
MRQFVVSVLIAGTAGGQRVRACDILTRELALKVSTAEGKGVVEKSKAFEDDLGPDTPSCKRGRILLVLNPFKNPAQYRKTLGKDWTPVPGIGEEALFRGGNTFADLYVFNGARTFSTQISVAPDDTPDTVKANSIALAKEVAARLR